MSQQNTTTNADEEIVSSDAAAEDDPCSSPSCIFHLESFSFFDRATLTESRCRIFFLRDITTTATNLPSADASELR